MNSKQILVGSGDPIEENSHRDVLPIPKNPIAFCLNRKTSPRIVDATTARREIRSTRAASRWKNTRKKRKEKEKDKEAKRRRRLLLLPENKVVLVTRGKSWRMAEYRLPTVYESVFTVKLERDLVSTSVNQFTLEERTKLQFA